MRQRHSLAGGIDMRQQAHDALLRSVPSAQTLRGLIEASPVGPVMTAWTRATRLHLSRHARGRDRPVMPRMVRARADERAVPVSAGHGAVP